MSLLVYYMCKIRFQLQITFKQSRNLCLNSMKQHEKLIAIQHQLYVPKLWKNNIYKDIILIFLTSIKILTINQLTAQNLTYPHSSQKARTPACHRFLFKFVTYYIEYKYLTKHTAKPCLRIGSKSMKR